MSSTGHDVESWSEASMSGPGLLRTELVTPERWDDVAAVFGGRGNAATCWCQWFEADRPAWGKANAQVNRSRLEQRIAESDKSPAGVLAYWDDRPAGWLRVGPLQQFPRLQNSRAVGSVLRPLTGDWLASCFVVRVGYRRRGVSVVLLRGGVSLARAQGAPALLGHPVDLAVLDRRPSAASLYTGTLSTFQTVGFSEVARSAPHRPIVRLDLVVAN